MAVLMGYRCALAAVILVATSAASGLQPVRRVLDNGARLIVASVPGTGRVAVESFYGVGFIHEPEGLTQAAHLIEHLVCTGATAEAAPGETYAALNETGMANAETLADFTHFDAMVAADRLGDVLRAEAARLTTLRIDDAIVAQEAPRCYQEAVAVESAPQAPLFKFALMAGHQSWRYRAESALIKGGLIEAPLDRVRAFHGTYYTPANLTLVIVGDIPADDAVALVRETVGAVPRLEPARVPAIDRAAMPRDAAVRWDSTQRAILISYDAPADDTDRLAVTLLGMLRGEAVYADETIGRDARFAIASSNIYPVGALPFFVYATLAQDADDGAADRIDTRARELLLREPAATEVAQLRGYLTQLRSPIVPTASAVRVQAKQIGPRMGVDEERAIGMVLGQAALTLGLADRLTAGREAAIEAVSKMSAQELRRVMERTLDPTRRVITRLVPAGPATPR